jgi:hypothetical protein
MPQTLYNNSGQQIVHSFTVSSSDTGTVEYGVANPSTFVAGAKDNAYDWIFSGHRTDLWSTTAKSLYDPCPTGWRVAPRAIWTGFTSTGNASTNVAEFNVDGDYKYGWSFVNGSGTVFFPAAGRRSFSPSLANLADNFTNIVNDDQGVGYPVGFYWSSDAPTTGALAFGHNYVNPSTVHDDIAETAAAGGFPLRCVAE